MQKQPRLGFGIIGKQGIARRTSIQLQHNIPVCRTYAVPGCIGATPKQRMPRHRQCARWQRIGKAAITAFGGVGGKLVSAAVLEQSAATLNHVMHRGKT